MTSYGGADLFEYMKHMTIKEALNLGLINKEAYSIIRSEKFWRFFVNRDYPYFVLDKDENPESAYRKIYDNRNDKYVTMRSGEIFEQFRYHQNIIEFNCFDNRLKSLVGCPPGVKTLHCSDNRLTSLVGCPASVRDLNCSGNQLSSLDGCPVNVHVLNCHNNRLTSLDGCPESVNRLYCSDNSLQTLNIYLPQVYYINYGNNPLIPPWNRYSEYDILKIMHDPAYHQL